MQSNEARQGLDMDVKTYEEQGEFPLEKISILDLQVHQLVRLGDFFFQPIAAASDSQDAANEQRTETGLTVGFAAPSINEETYSWVIEASLYGFQFSIHCGNEIFYPLEKRIAQKIRLNWEDKKDRPLIFQALFAQYLSHQMVFSPNNPLKSDQPLLSQPELVALFDALRIDAVHALPAEDAVATKVQKDCQLARDISLSLKFFDLNTGQVAHDLALKLSVSNAHWSRLVCWADNLYLGARLQSNLGEYATLSLCVLKPFTRLTMLEVGKLEHGDAVSMEPIFKPLYWIKVAGASQLIQISINEQAEFSYRMLSTIPKAEFGSHVISLGLKKSVTAKAWLQDWRSALVPIITDLHANVTDIDGSFYQGLSAMGPAKVIDYEGEGVLQFNPPARSMDF